MTTKYHITNNMPCDSIGDSPLLLPTGAEGTGGAGGGEGGGVGDRYERLEGQSCGVGSEQWHNLKNTRSFA